MSPQQQRLLTIFALFDTEGHQVGRTREVLEKLSGEPCTDLKFVLKSLVDAGLLMQYDYNWRSDTYEYRIADRLMVPSEVFRENSALAPPPSSRFMALSMT